jgi:hypothetical protein
MKHQWLAYVIVGLLSIGAGIAIAGLPNNVPVDATIIPPTTTEAPRPTLPETTEPETTEPETTEPETTEPETTEPETTDPETTEPETTDSVPAELPDRSELNVAAANGANVAGAALRVATQLEALGYVEILPLNGTDIVEFSVVYYAEGFEEAALRLAEDLELAPEFVAPIEDAPSVPDLPADIELLAYVGRDRA